MRPSAIIWFERLFLGSLFLGFINLFLSMDQSIEMMALDPNAAALGNPVIFIVVVYVISLSISLLLWFFIARRASTVAKWILIAIFALGLLSLPSSIAMGVFSGFTGLLAALVWLLNAASLVFLFMPEANAWFKGETQPDDIASRFD